MKIGLVLGSGGSRGTAHIGVLNVLRKNNIPIDFVAGTSIGSLIGSYYALTKDTDLLEKESLRFTKRDMIKLVDLNDPRVSFLKGQKIKKYLGNLFGNKTFADVQIPLRVVATDLEDGSKKVFTEGRLIDAIMASVAVPGIFPPVKTQDGYLVDGGLSDALPISEALNMGADLVIAVDLYAYQRYPIQKCTLHNTLERTFQLMLSKLSAQPHKENVIIIKPKVDPKHDWLDFSNAKNNIRAGEEAALESLSLFQRQLR